MTDGTMDSPGLGRGGRMSRPRKRDAVLRLLRGEDLELVSRSLGVTAATLTNWRDDFLAAGEAALATKPTDGKDPSLPGSRPSSARWCSSGSCWPRRLCVWRPTAL